MNHADLHAEFWRAVGRARSARVAEMLGFLKLSSAVPWGLARIRARGSYYHPTDEGDEPFALIAPMVFERSLVDLCAIEMATGATYTRTGDGWALGHDLIDEMRWQERTLTLVERPIQWLKRPTASACILDYSRARFALDGIGKINCTSLELVERIEAAFAAPAVPLPLFGIEQ